MATNWRDFKKSLNLTPEEEKFINLEESLITAVVEAREKSGLTQKLKPLSYTLAVVKEEATA